MKRKNRKRKNRKRNYQRRLRLEKLDARQMLAGDLMPEHNAFDPEDVNDDGIVSPLDMSLLVSDLRGHGRHVRGRFVDVDGDGERTPSDALRVINRLRRDEGERRGRHSDKGSSLENLELSEFRTSDGTGNNLENPLLGSAGSQLLRIAAADYADKVSEPAGEDRPGAREISNALFSHGTDDVLNDRGLSAFIYVWGQFIDHDIDLTLTQSEGESTDISVPMGDSFFDPDETGTATIHFSRSVFDETTGTDADNPRQQVNAITSWIDGSMIYGSDPETADSLREFAAGRLLVGDDNLLPMGEDGLVRTGDIRAAENPALTSMHVLFMREHNYWAEKILSENPGLSDEEVFQQARAIVVGEIQAITYREFLPALLGRRSIDKYQGYDPSVDSSIATEFSTAAFRFGHSTLDEEVEFLDERGEPVRDPVALRDAFFNVGLLEETGIGPILKGSASHLSEEIDLQVIDSLRNFLFGPPGAGGLDLVALNIQRGRDHGLADYNSVREAYGLPRVDSFSDISSDASVQESLAELYGSVDNIDLWVGGLAEDHVPGGSTGPTFQRIIADQFERLRDGDRFWYQNTFRGNALRSLERTQLSDILIRNTSIDTFQPNVFFVGTER